MTKVKKALFDEQHFAVIAWFSLGRLIRIANSQDVVDLIVNGDAQCFTEELGLGVALDETDDAAETAGAETYRLGCQHNVLAQHTCINLTTAFRRRANQYNIRRSAEQIFEAFVAGYLLGVLLFEHVVNLSEQLLILYYAQNPRLTVTATGGVDATLDQIGEFLVLYRLIELLTDRTAGHDGLGHRVVER